MIWNYFLIVSVTGELQKEVYKMKYIDKTECDNFYVHKQVTGFCLFLF